MPNVLNPRDIVSRPDNMDETELHTYVAHVSLYKCNYFCYRFLQVVFANLHQKTPKICNCDWLLPCLILSFDPAHWCIPLQNCFHNRKTVSLKSKTEILKIPEISDV